MLKLISRVMNRLYTTTMRDIALYRDGDQVDREQAIAIFDGELWKEWDLEFIAKFQLYQERLCVPFDKFQEAMEHILDRSVWTHEFAQHGTIKAEYEGKRGKPTFDDIFKSLEELLS